MKTNIAAKTTLETKKKLHLPEKKLHLPDQIDLIEEDGTVYHVRSFFVAKKTMGEVLNAVNEQIRKLIRHQEYSDKRERRRMIPYHDNLYIPPDQEDIQLLAMQQAHLNSKICIRVNLKS